MHHRKTPRAQRYDYTSSGGYFVTICTKDREHYFGEIHNGEMKLNALGKYCHDYITTLTEQRKAVDIHEWVVMPNHVHLLLIMSEFSSQMNEPYTDTRKTDPIDDRRDDLLGRPNNDQYNAIGHAKSMSLQTPIMNPSYQGPTLGSVINMFKGAVTKYANEHDLVFAWQSRYHDHIIRNESEYNRIKYYIQTNPENRDTDTLQ